MASVAGLAAAGTVSGNVNVSATLNSACEVSASGGAISFGGITNLLSAGDKTANSGSTFQVACSSDMSPTIYSTTARVMDDGATGVLPFNLSLTSGAASNDLPTAQVDGVALSITKDGTLKTVTLYAKVLASNFTGANAQPGGAYSKVVTVSVDY